MNKTLRLIFILFLSVMTTSSFATSYSQLWSQFAKAQSADHPKEMVACLDEIIAKARPAKDYGQLIKAEMLRVGVRADISPDSLQNDLARLDKERKSAAPSSPERAIWSCLLAKVYEGQEDKALLVKTLKTEAMAYPATLAATSATGYEPTVCTEDFSKIFYNDLLHVIGMELREYDWLHNYYATHDNRPAACICAVLAMRQQDDDADEEKTTVRQQKKLKRLDSLINVYSDLKECGELAIERYKTMSDDENITAKWRYEYINYALAQWGSWPRMNVLRNAQNELTLPSFNAELEQSTERPTRDIPVYIRNLVNIHDLTCTVTRVNVKGDTPLNVNDERDLAALRKLAEKTPAVNMTHHYYGHPVYETVNDTFKIGRLKPGIYLVEFACDANNMKTDVQLLHVSDLYVFHQQLSKEQTRFVVVNSTTGKPVSEAHLRISRPLDNRPVLRRSAKAGADAEGDVLATLTTDGKGEALWTWKGDREWGLRLFAYTDQDQHSAETGVGRNYYNYKDNRQQDYAALFTDRGIYRPGQKVSVSLIAYHHQNHIENRTVGGKAFKVRLRDANYKEIASETVTTDDYGTASTSFTLPSSGLTGWFSISTEGASTAFRVEEYKRPTFRVEFDNPTVEYHRGDTVEVKGRATTFSGLPVKDALVKYSVRRESGFWWFRNNADRKLLADDSCRTDDKGEFTVRVPMTMPDVKSRYAYYRFITKATVTNDAGETQEGTSSLPLGKASNYFAVSLQSKLLRDSLKTIKFTYQNAAGEDVKATVNYHIEGMDKSFTAPTNETVKLDGAISGLKSGRYTLLAICGTDTLSHEFTLFSVDDKHPVANSSEWFWQSAAYFPRDGKPVYLQVGSSDEDVQVYYTILSEDRLMEKGSFTLDNAIKTYKLNYKEEYGRELYYSFAWVKDGVCHSRTFTVTRPDPDKALNLRWTTFRDKVTPGDEEEWTLNITRNDNSKDIFAAEDHKSDVATGLQLMATMYDQSLDKFNRLNWPFTNGNITLFTYDNTSTPTWNAMDIGRLSLFGEQTYKSLAERPLSFSHFDSSLYGLMFQQEALVGSIGGRVPGVMLMRASKMNTVADASNALAERVVSVSAVMRKEAKAGNAVTETDTETDASTSGLRENLNETAFFYPALEADKDGNVKIKFRLPESVTTWRFLALAHDKNMSLGYLEATTVAQKSVMCQPNMPRFIREGDDAQIRATISNTTDVSTSGTARLQILDPQTEKVLFEQSKRFNLGTKDDKPATVAFDIHAGTAAEALHAGLYIARVTAQTKAGSDGEQHYLPILTNREWVTNTKAFTQNNPGTKTIDLKTICDSKDGKADYTIEYTNNPAWLMVQTLPYVTRTADEDAVSQAAAYYVNSVGAWMMRQDPKIKSTVSQWMRNKDSQLVSPLEENSELKSLSLNDTPWMWEAENETKQKQSLTKFFDENSLRYGLQQNLSKLRKLQLADGSFSWWPGMPGNRYMTTSVALILTRKDVMNGMDRNAEAEDILSKAYAFLEKAVSEEVSDLKKEEKKGHKDLAPSELACNFLYISAMNGKKATSDITYLVNLLAKQPTKLTIYGKAMSAIILNHYGKGTVAKSYMQSVDEYTVYKEEMGRYFDTPRALYSWRDYRIPSQVAAIEAYKLLHYGDSKGRIQEMQRWLLQEKRTQCWDTPINTVEAVYAFLEGNDTQPLTSKAPSTLMIDGKRINTDTSTAGLGYVKTRLKDSHATTFTAEKTSEGTSWGAVYAQFWQPATEAKSASNGMAIKREVLTEDGKPVSGALSVGQKVKVRITIVADRDYDFVQVQDKRAACMEPASQLSGYHWGYYIAPKDNVTNYYFDMLSKGTHVVETDYYIDRQGTYQTGVCTAQCAYSPAYSARAKALTIYVK